jgi:hypothetical protein
MNREFGCRPLNSKAWLRFFVKLSGSFGGKDESVTSFRSSTLVHLPAPFLKRILPLIQLRTADAVYPNVSNWPRPKVKRFTASCNGQIRYSYLLHVGNELTEKIYKLLTGDWYHGHVGRKSSYSAVSITFNPCPFVSHKNRLTRVRKIRFYGSLLPAVSVPTQVVIACV